MLVWGARETLTKLGRFESILIRTNASVRMPEHMFRSLVDLHPNHHFANIIRVAAFCLHTEQDHKLCKLFAKC